MAQVSLALFSERNLFFCSERRCPACPDAFILGSTTWSTHLSSLGSTLLILKVWSRLVILLRTSALRRKWFSVLRQSCLSFSNSSSYLILVKIVLLLTS